MKRIILPAVALAVLAGSAPSIAQTVILRDDDAVRIRTWTGPTERVRVRETFTVGTAVPETVTIHSFPADVGVSGYSYVYDSNDRVVVVEPRTRKVIRIIER